jgi:methyltransferase of ATP-grasp peptide maturase system
MRGWREHADALARELVAAGKLWSPEWQDAVRAVPRHEFVPLWYERKGSAWLVVSRESQPERWLERVYANTALVTLLGEATHGDGSTIAALSSSSAPGLMTRMLEALEVDTGDRVLEIGTGTGYNAALLSHRLGDRHVFSIDIELDLIRQARDRLSSCGYRPVLGHGDGAFGWPAGAPYDRVIGTCAVDRVPWEWVRQTRQDGVIVVDAKLATLTGNLVKLRRTGNHAEGRFLPGWSDFMPLRGATTGTDVDRHPERNRDVAERRTTAVLTERPWEEPTLWFLAGFWLPRGVRFGYTVDEDTNRPDAVFLSAPDGSWCEVSVSVDGDGLRVVWEAGPRRLWRTVEAAEDLWQQEGRPGWPRFGLTVSEHGQTVWLDTPKGLTNNSAAPC